LFSNNTSEENKNKISYPKNNHKEDLSEEINKGENKVTINKQIFTMSILKDKTLLCKIKICHVKMKYRKQAFLYNLYEDFTNKFIMSCRKVSNLSSTEYIFSSEENALEISQEKLIGKLTSKFLGNEYGIYDMTENKDNFKDLNSPFNKLVGTIEYVKNYFV
jgi:hypothetical protein